MIDAVGWACVLKTPRVIDVRSVSPTKRACMVNALVTQLGIMVTNDWTDQDIERAWQQFGAAIADILEVNIAVRE